MLLQPVPNAVSEWYYMRKGVFIPVVVSYGESVVAIFCRSFPHYELSLSSMLQDIYKYYDETYMY